MPTSLLFRDDAYLRCCETTVTAADVRGIRLGATVFYPAGGGQPGDTGWLRFAGGETPIVDTVKGEGADEIVHVPAPGAPVPPPGTAVVAEIDWERRYRHMRFHTCLHLLCAAVPHPVTGGRIAADKAHLDFDLRGATAVEKEAVEAKLNALIAAGHRVAPRWITDEELAASPELVRTMSVAPPLGQGRVRLLEVDHVDLQACGGTHVANTSEIGAVAVLKIRSEGKRNKRITIGFAGEAAE